jgi:hypothetical protein
MLACFALSYCEMKYISFMATRLDIYNVTFFSFICPFHLFSFIFPFSPFFGMFAHFALSYCEMKYISCITTRLDIYHVTFFFYLPFSPFCVSVFLLPFPSFFVWFFYCPSFSFFLKFVSSMFLAPMGFISSLPQLAWD